jgi:zeta-carotene isomerase
MRHHDVAITLAFMLSLLSMTPPAVVIAFASPSALFHRPPQQSSTLSYSHMKPSTSSSSSRLYSSPNEPVNNNNPLLSTITKSRISNRVNDLLVGEDSGIFDIANEKWGSLSTGTGWSTFLLAVTTILTAVAVLWINPSTGYGDDLVQFLEKDVAHGNSHYVTLAFGIIFPIVHSGLASLRPIGERIVGPRIWRVIFAFPSLCLSYSWIVYFISHVHDGYELYNISQIYWVHTLAWCINFISFLFLYPSVYNLKEVAAVDKPMVHLWETGVIRITRHPQYIGQVLWSIAHLAMVGTSFSALTMILLVSHHAFACWNGDRRLEAEHGDKFLALKERTSIMPFRAIIDGRQILPPDYWKELIRPPLLVIAVGSFGAYLAHPYMQAGAASYVNAGYSPGGILSGIW